MPQVTRSPSALAARIRSKPALVVTNRKWIAPPVWRASSTSRAIAIASAQAGAWGRPRRVAVSPLVATARAVSPLSSAWDITVRPRPDA